MSSPFPIRALDSDDPGVQRAADLARRAELLERGYTTVPNVLDGSELASCRALSERLGARLEPSEYRTEHASIGSLLDVLVDPEVIELIT